MWTVHSNFSISSSMEGPEDTFGHITFSTHQSMEFETIDEAVAFTRTLQDREKALYEQAMTAKA